MADRSHGSVRPAAWAAQSSLLQILFIIKNNTVRQSYQLENVNTNPTKTEGFIFERRGVIFAPAGRVRPGAPLITI
jgi:hypothetical protein